jgi:hypothetical protein
LCLQNKNIQTSVAGTTTAPIDGGTTTEAVVNIIATVNMMDETVVIGMENGEVVTAGNTTTEIETEETVVIAVLNEGGINSCSRASKEHGGGILFVILKVQEVQVSSLLSASSSAIVNTNWARRKYHIKSILHRHKR